MKKFLAIWALAISAVVLISGCSKVEPLPNYSEGTTISLSASRTSVVPTIADSNTKLLALGWTNPNYATDPKTYKFVIEIDSAGRNFAKATKREVIGKLTDSITGRELNAILLNNGFTIGTAYNLDIRVLS